MKKHRHYVKRPISNHSEYVALAGSDLILVLAFIGATQAMKR